MKEIMKIVWFSILSILSIFGIVISGLIIGNVIEIPMWGKILVYIGTAVILFIISLKLLMERKESKDWLDECISESAI